MTLLRWLTFLLGSLAVVLTVLLFWIYLFLLALVFILHWCFPHWEILLMLLSAVSIDFPSNSKRDAPFHWIAYDYSWADQYGLGDYLRDVPMVDIFKLGASAAVSEFVSGFWWEFMYISVIINIRSSLTHLHSFQLLVPLP